MTLFGLIRHGQTDYNLNNIFQGSSDIPLNETGKAQALQALNSKTAAKWNFIGSSDLKRAVQTAEIISKAYQIPFLGSFSGIREVHFGEVEGMAAKEVYAKYPDRKFPGRESANEALARASETILELTRNYPNANILLVSHGSLMRYIAAAITARAFGSLPNASLTELRVESNHTNKWTLMNVGSEHFASPISFSSKDLLSIPDDLEAPIIKRSN